MNADLLRDIRANLLRDFSFKDRGDWLREGECPSCKKKELYTKAESPWWIRCGRINNCGYEASVKDLYDELFSSWSDRFKPTEANPTASADAYLASSRGFDVRKLGRCYTQESYIHPETRDTTATVRFAIPGGAWWERLIDRPSRFGKMKARFAPGKSIGGRWWIPPAKLIDVTTADELWIVEGIFDAIALAHHGIAAVSAMSSNNYPTHGLADLVKARNGEKPKLVWALDGDAAGREYAVRWARRCAKDGWTCRAATIPQPKDGTKLDWNELHVRDQLGEDDINRWFYEGSLLLARSAWEKGRLMYRHTEMHSFSFEHGNKLWWFEFDNATFQRAMKETDGDRTEEERRAEAIKKAGKVEAIANCNPEPLYFEKNLLTGDHAYYVRVATARGGTVKDTFRGEQLVSASDFKKRLMSVVAGASYFGTTQQLDRHWGDDLQVIKHVEAIDFVGYSRDHGAYLLGDVAVKDGRVLKINEEDFFELGRRMHVKSPRSSVTLKVEVDQTTFRTDWLDKAWRCWGEKGMVALTFWFGSLFAEQIRAEQESFPFLELIGEPASGKTTLIKFMWKLMGRLNYEGLDPSKSTLAARARAFVQVANLPVVLTEGDRKDDTARAKKFDFNELKTAYNGGSIRALGVKSAGNQTIEPPFRGAIVIEQNAPVEADRAVLERIVHLEFDKSRFTAETKLLSEELARMNMAELSHFVLKVAKAEARVMDRIRAEVPVFERELTSKIRDMRLAKNHAQLLAIFNAMRLVLPINDEQAGAVQDFIKSMALKRQAVLSDDHPVVQTFWEIFDYINPQGAPTAIDPNYVLDHSRNPDLIAVNLQHFQAEAASRYLKAPDMTDLKQFLPTSNVRKFVDRRTVNSGIDNRSHWCFVFKKPKSTSPATPASIEWGSGE